MIFVESEYHSEILTRMIFVGRREWEQPPPLLQIERCKDVTWGAVLNSRRTFSQACKAVPRRARMQGSSTSVSLNSRLESDTDEEEEGGMPRHLW